MQINVNGDKLIDCDDPYYIIPMRSLCMILALHYSYDLYYPLENSGIIVDLMLSGI